MAATAVALPQVEEILRYLCDLPRLRVTKPKQHKAPV